MSGAQAQRAYVERQKERDPEGWAARQAEHERNRYKRSPKRKQPLFEQEPERYAELARQARATWNQRNPEKRHAHNAVRRAVKSGVLVRPDQCARCGRECKPQASHDDYNKPLDVEWLCQPCHKLKDSKFNDPGPTEPGRESR